MQPMDRFLEILDKASTPHDGAFRFGFGDFRVARQFFTTYLPPSVSRHLDLLCLEPVNKSFVDEQFNQRHSDMIYKTRLKGETAFLYLLFEHQSSPDQMMIYRLFGYMNNFWKQYESRHADVSTLPVVLPLVLYHGSQTWNAPKRFCDILAGYTEDFAPFTPDFSYMLFDLNDYGKDVFHQSTDALLHLVLMQFRHIFDDDMNALIEMMSGLLNQIEPSDSFDKFGRWVFTYIYSARSESTETLIEHASRAIHKTQNKKLWRIAMTAAEQWRQKMRDEGR
ncbi:MAG: hypothetical protein CR990_00345, partial [Desulfococcus sp.]